MTSSFFEKNEDEVNNNTKKHTTRARGRALEESEMNALLMALSSLSPETHQERRSIPSNLRILRNTHTHTHTRTHQKDKSYIPKKL